MVTQRPARAKRPAKAGRDSKQKPLWEALREIAEGIPPEAWEGFPTDAAKDFDALLEPEWVDGRAVKN